MGTGRAQLSETFRHRYGPWAVVAGASTGLGAAYARELAGRGLSLVLIARRADLLERIAAELRGGFGVEVRALPLNLASPELPAVLERETGTLEVGLVVYNAAFPNPGPFLDRSLESHLAVVDTNCRGPVVLAHYYGKKMSARGRGGIVLMSSLTAFNGSPGVASYGATKGFNLILGEGLWYELRSSGVDVTVCCAGVIRTPGYESSADTSRFSPPTLSPEEVARTTLNALGRRSVVIPGTFNRTVSFLMRRLFARRLTVRIMGGAVSSLELE